MLDAVAPSELEHPATNTAESPARPAPSAAQNWRRPITVIADHCNRVDALRELTQLSAYEQVSPNPSTDRVRPVSRRHDRADAHQGAERRAPHTESTPTRRAKIGLIACVHGRRVGLSNLAATSDRRSAGRLTCSRPRSESHCARARDRCIRCAPPNMSPIPSPPSGRGQRWFVCGTSG